MMDGDQVRRASERMHVLFIGLHISVFFSSILRMY